jgi:hypothetical protein
MRRRPGNPASTHQPGDRPVASAALVWRFCAIDLLWGAEGGQNAIGPSKVGRSVSSPPAGQKVRQGSLTVQDQAGIHAAVLVDAHTRSAIHRNGTGAFGIDGVRAADISPLRGNAPLAQATPRSALSARKTTGARYAVPFPLPYLVIPAKAGIQSFWQPLDSRFRGNDDVEVDSRVRGNSVFQQPIRTISLLVTRDVVMFFRM